MAKIAVANSSEVFVGFDIMKFDDDDVIYTLVFGEGNEPGDKIVFSSHLIEFMLPSHIVDHYMSEVEFGNVGDEFIKSAAKYMDNWVMYDVQYLLQKYEDALNDSFERLRHIRTLIQYAGNEVMAKHYVDLINKATNGHSESIGNVYRSLLNIGAEQ